MAGNAVVGGAGDGFGGGVRGDAGEDVGADPRQVDEVHEGGDRAGFRGKCGEAGFEGRTHAGLPAFGEDGLARIGQEGAYLFGGGTEDNADGVAAGGGEGVEGAEDEGPAVEFGEGFGSPEPPPGPGG